MKSAAHHRTLPLGWRLTSLLATALVLALSIFAASPELHAWLHSHEHVAGSPHAGVSDPSSHERPDAPRDDDACAVVLFAHGVLGMAVLGLLGILAWRVGTFVFSYTAHPVSRVPRYWLPPLCGPPLS